MIFKSWLILEELFPNKTATVYHRTKSLDNIQGTLASGFKKTSSETWSGNCLYGCGLYTTFDINSQFNDYMKAYGDYLIKFKINDLSNYLIFQIQVAKYILGKNYKISDQLKKLTQKKFNQVYLDKLDKEQENSNYSSKIFKEFYDENKWIENELFGGIYRGQNDGYCLLKYHPIDSSVTMIAYSHAPTEKSSSDIKWITNSRQLRIKDVYRSKFSQKRSDQSILGPEDMSYDNLIYASKNNLFDLIIKFLKQTRSQSKPGSIIPRLINSSPEKQKIIELIVKYKNQFSSSDLYSIITNSFYLDLRFFKDIIEKLGQNINDISIEDFNEFLKHLSDEEKKLFLGQVLQNKKDLDMEEVNLLFLYNKEEKIVNMVVSKIGVSQTIRYLIPSIIDSFSTNKEEFFEFINMIKIILKTPEAIEEQEYYIDYIKQKLASSGFADTYAAIDYIKNNEMDMVK